MDGKSDLAEELNKQFFTVDDLSEDSYYKKFGETSIELKEEIENGIKEKFNEESEILDKVDWERSDRGHVLYAMLKKEFTYIEPLKLMGINTFADENVYVEYFGIDSVADAGTHTIDILFYESEECFAIKLKTKEGEEVYLYRGADFNKSFNENFETLQEKASVYEGRTEFGNGDIVKIPKIKLKEVINYDELCGRMIKGLDEYINQALQTIDFELDNYGGHVKSEALIETLKCAAEEEKEKMKILFNDEFVVYLKEEGKEVPYFALKVTDTDVLVKSEHQPDENGNLTEVTQTIPKEK